MIRQLGQVYVLDTNGTTYALMITDTGHCEHLYYGDRIILDTREEAEVLREKHAFAPGNSIIYDNDHKSFSLENMRLEMSSRGKGDIREPFIELIHADGSMTSDFLYESGTISEGKQPLDTLPSSYDDTTPVEQLCLTLRDKSYGLTLEMHYYVFPEKDVIVRSAKLINSSKAPVIIRRLMSAQLDFETDDYFLTTFNGVWAREMERHVHPIRGCLTVNSSVCGASSNRANPFVMLSKAETTEDYGSVYGLNLVYSGNHYESAEASGYHKTRFLCGINPEGFSYHLAAGECFEAPEAVMTFSSRGYNGMSRNMHRFVRDNICRGEWKHKPRPVLLNSWEAAYFDINEHRLLKLAKAGKDVGVELFVMDDGWFAHRNDDSSSLGDWYVNIKKLPDGLSGLANKINALGLDFGIWVEPEMVSVDSDLYRSHPDWVMEIPGKPHSEGRSQRILNFANPEVVDYMTEAMEKVFSSASISYVKWDMNRIFSDVYSPCLPPERQQETAHRYIMGVYRMVRRLTETFPHILFEGCASGGNRFDLGMLCYFPQIWASDDTDAAFRVQCQTNYSYGYPLSAISAHVSSCPNHQTLRVTPLETRFNVAAFGVCGYECNLCDMSKEDLQEIREQIALYKQWRNVLQYGDFYRGRHSGNIFEWTCVSGERSHAVGMLMQLMVEPNSAFQTYSPKGLDPAAKYHFTNRGLKYNVKNFGDLINTAAPVHIRPGSVLHSAAAKFIKMPGEQEDAVASGSVLMAGVKLKPAFAATGYNENVRFFQDYGSRMYFIEPCQTPTPQLPSSGAQED